jgi:hypothetical protein
MFGHLIDAALLVLFALFLFRLTFGLTASLVYAPSMFAVGPAIIERFVQRLNLTNGASSFLDLPRDFLYAGLQLRLSGNMTISAGATNGTLHDENPMSYLRRIVVEGTGGGQSVQLKNYRGIHAFRGEHLLSGIEPPANPLLSAAIGGPTAWSCVVNVFFNLPHPRTLPELSYRTVLNPREFSRLGLEIQAGDETDFVNGGDRTEALTGVVCDVYALQVVNFRLVQSPLRYIETYLMRDSLSAVASERRFSNQLPVGRPYRYLMLRTTNEVTNARQPVDDTLTALKLFIAQTLVLRYSDFREYAHANKKEHAVIAAVNPAGLNALSSRDNPAIGYYMLDFLKDGRLEGVLDASRFPARGIPIDLLHDVAIATARQLDVVAGFLTPSPFGQNRGQQSGRR